MSKHNLSRTIGIIVMSKTPIGERSLRRYGRNRRKEGTLTRGDPGSALSPLLSNILLNELDRELEKRGHRYVRYADDFSIYVRSKTAARRVGNSIYVFLRDVLRLPINREKSGIRRPSTFNILGYYFVPVFKKGVKGQYQLVVSAKSWKTFKLKLKELTRKTIPMSFDQRIQRLNRLIRGWRTAQSPILKTTITLARLKRRGYIAMLEMYHQIKLR